MALNNFCIRAIFVTSMMMSMEMLKRARAASGEAA
jgi:hypothetical protein